MGFAPIRDSHEYTVLKKMLETSDFTTHSFFTLFGFVGPRWVSETEDAEARAVCKRHVGRTWENTLHDDEVRVCPGGEELAQILAEDVFPNAIKYFSEYYPSIAWHG